MHGEKFATLNPVRIAFISGYVRRHRHMNGLQGKRRFVRSGKTDKVHVRTCHPNTKKPSREETKPSYDRLNKFNQNAERHSKDKQFFPTQAEPMTENGGYGISVDKQKTNRMIKKNKRLR